MEEVEISHWGSTVASNVKGLLEEPALSRLNVHLAQAFQQIEQEDLLVSKVVITQTAPMELSIHAKADLSGDVSKLRKDAVREYVHKAPCCPECSCPIVDGKIHPENGCSYGIVDYVMST